MGHLETLVTSRSWCAKPWDYNSVICVRFLADSSCELTFGYGQTIYAKIEGRFSLSEENEMALIYLESPPYQWFKGFKPPHGCESRSLRYSLTEGMVEGIEDYGAVIRFNWTLTLNVSPFPEGLTLPFDVPLIYYGHREELPEELTPKS